MRCHIRQYNRGNLRNLHNLLLHLQWAFHVQEIIFRAEFFAENGKVTKKIFFCNHLSSKEGIRKTQNHRKVTVFSARTRTDIRLSQYFSDLHIHRCLSRYKWLPYRWFCRVDSHRKLIILIVVAVLACTHSRDVLYRRVYVQV